MADTKIEWCDKVWNPVVGCTKCSPGCLNCYAERMAKRLYLMGMEKPATLPEYMKFKEGWKDGHIELCNHRLDQPPHWRKPNRIFVCSMSDLFHEKVPFEFIDKVRRVIWKCLPHTFLILTKRPKYLYEYCEAKNQGTGVWPNNVHLGVSISNQSEADEKIPILLQIPAAVRWLSIEPMLEGIDLKLLKGHDIKAIGTLTGNTCICNLDTGAMINGVVVGGESGPKRRWCNIRWIQSIVDQCKAANVPVFVKQIHRDGKVVKMPKEFPQELPKRS